jgi:hypothetical protein
MLNQTNLRFLPALGLSVLNLQYELQIIGLLVPYNQKHNIFRQQGKLKEKKKRNPKVKQNYSNFSLRNLSHGKKIIILKLP